MTKQELPRIQFEVDPDIKRRIEKRLKWGQMRMLYGQITLDLLEILENNDPQMIVAAILSEEVSLADYIGRKKKGKDGRHTGPKTECDADESGGSSKSNEGDKEKS